MTINYGKRNPGGLTAASPGDTLYVPFSTYNDSGASIGIGGTLAVGDVEIFKNGNATPRATDSGYSLISDTGQYGDRIGLHRFSIQIFNTSDDTGFFDLGSQYHVAVDAITVDGRTVRFFPAVFELGTERANVVQIAGDTGHAVQLGKFASVLSSAGQIDTGTGAADTGVLSNSVWNSLKASHGDTGSFGEELGQGVNAVKLRGDTGAADRLFKLAGSKLTDSGTFDTGTGVLRGAAATVDTGAINNAVWNGNVSDHVADTGSFGYAQGRLLAVKGDTGAAHLDGGRLGVSASAIVDTGVMVNAIWNANVSDHVADTGAFGYTAGRLMAVKGDTGAAHLDAGRLGVSASAVVDTGVVVNAVWGATVSAHVVDTGSFGYAQGRLMAVHGDTGAAHLDQGRLGVISDTGRQAAVLDTGKVASAVWSSHQARTLTAFGFDTGIAQTVWRSSSSEFVGDTGSVGYAQGRVMAIRGDTGAAHLSGGRLGVNTIQIAGDTGAAAHLAQAFAIQSTSSDTGLIANAAAIRTQTDKLTFDTGANELHADIRKVNNIQIQGAGDTGLGNTWRPV